MDKGDYCTVGKKTRLKELENIGKTWNEAKKNIARHRVGWRATVVVL